MKTYRIIIVMIATVLMSACDVNSKVTFKYDHSERYSVGGAVLEQPVNKISVDWYAGGVSIRYGDQFRISEESDSDLIDSLQMRYYMSDDSELNIQFCQSGTYRHGQLEQINKRLAIEVPRDATLDEIEINMVGGLVSIDSVSGRELSLNVVDVATTVWTPTLPDEIDVDAVNATLRLYVPPTAGMTIEMDGIKAELNSDLPVRKEDKKTIIGDGRCKVDVDAVKGSVFINKLNNE